MQPALCCGTRALKQSGGGCWEERFTSLSCLVCRAPCGRQEASPSPHPCACVLPNLSCCLPQAQSCSSQVCQREPFRKHLSLSGYSWQLYLPGQPQQSEPKIRSTPGLFCLPGSQLGSPPEQTAFCTSSCQTPPYGLSHSSPLPTPALWLPALLQWLIG